MIGAIVVLGVVAVVLAAALVLIVRQHDAERRGWAEERRLYIDRAIASHVGEIVALDRTARKEPRNEQERPQAVGL